jgi:hypothetical protein
MRHSNGESSSNRFSDTGERITSDTNDLGPVTEFLGIGIMLALLLLS